MSKKLKNTKQNLPSFTISLTDYQIMRHIQRTCKGYENILADIKK